MSSYRGAHRRAVTPRIVLSDLPLSRGRRAPLVAGIAVVALGVSAAALHDGPASAAAAPLAGALVGGAATPVAARVAEGPDEGTIAARQLRDAEKSDAAAAKAEAARVAKAAAEAAAAKEAKAKAAAAAAAKALADAQADPQALAQGLAAQRGWGGGEFACLSQLWTKESSWRFDATNPSSGAYGIPQSLPAEKMATAGADWRTNPATQIAWGLGYIKASYGTPCGAWAHSQATGWY